MRRRYRQVKQDDGTYKMVEIGGSDSRSTPSLNLGDFAEYRSPIDGSVISTARQHEEHKRRHGVVEMREFGDDHWKRAEQERRKVYEPGHHSAAEKWKRRAVIHEAMNRAER